MDPSNYNLFFDDFYHQIIEVGTIPTSPDTLPSPTYHPPSATQAVAQPIFSQMPLISTSNISPPLSYSLQNPSFHNVSLLPSQIVLNNNIQHIQKTPQNFPSNHTPHLVFDSPSGPTISTKESKKRKRDTNTNDEINQAQKMARVEKLEKEVSEESLQEETREQKWEKRAGQFRASSKRYRAKKKAAEENLKAEVTELQSENEQNEATIAKLRQDNQELSKENQQLSKQNQLITEANQQLKQQITANLGETRTDVIEYISNQILAEIRKHEEEKKEKMQEIEKQYAQNLSSHVENIVTHMFSTDKQG